MQKELVGGLEPWNFMTFHSFGNGIIPTDFHSIIFQRGRAQPPTREKSNQKSENKKKVKHWELCSFCFFFFFSFLLFLQSAGCVFFGEYVFDNVLLIVC